LAPVYAAAVVFARGARIPGVNDSKKLTACTRDRLAGEIKARAVAWSVASAAVDEIDTINIYWASLLAMRRAVEGLSILPQHLLIAARRLRDVATAQQPIIKGDCKCMSIAAASILAKTARDTVMKKLDSEQASPITRAIRFANIRSPSNASVRVPPISAPSPVRTVLGLPPLPPWPSVGERKAKSKTPA
jgi:ribonuclease HII